MFINFSFTIFINIFESDITLNIKRNIEPMCIP